MESRIRLIWCVLGSVVLLGALSGASLACPAVGLLQCNGNTVEFCSPVSGGPQWLPVSTCLHGCDAAGGMATCRCPGGVPVGEELCVGGDRHQCVASAIPEGNTELLGACAHGCSLLGSTTSCHCAYGPPGAKSCVGSNRVQCASSTVSGGASQTLNSCFYGCYEQLGASFCRCLGGRQAGDELCSGNNVAQCVLTTSNFGAFSVSTFCSTGCTEVDNATASCNCASGASVGEEFCDGTTRMQCNATQSNVGNSVALGTCFFGCYTNENGARCACTEAEYTAGETFCGGDWLYLCNETSSTFGSVSVADTCNDGNPCTFDDCQDPGGCVSVPGEWADINKSGDVDVSDVQCMIISVLDFLGGSTAIADCVAVAPGDLDVDCDGVLAVSDVVLVIARSLNQPLVAELDQDGDFCADACQ